ncbi:MAG: hypothetical protein CMJ19_09575 [Phycisphaeraceae bacterium]|nr:hypothetical protein [Phycisphaeraceae bacterium]
MPTQRVYLDWQDAALPAAAQWLLDHELAHDQLIVVPGSRAGRRLMELLLEKADGSLVDPPTITTIGSIAEKLITDLPAITCPSALQLALIHAAQQVDPEQLKQLTPNIPDHSQTLAWMSLIQPIERLLNMLGSAGLVPGDVMQQSTDWPDFAQHQRWEVVTQIHQQYVQLLEQLNLHDLNLQRIKALEENRITYTSPITLIGTVDINQLTCNMLDLVTGPITALIHAPQSHANHFGDYGQLDTQYWHQAPLDIPHDMRIVTHQPADQVAAMLSDLQSLSTEQTLSNDQLTIGVADEQLGPMVEQLTEKSGLKSRWHQQREIMFSRPVTLLSAITQYARSNQTVDLASLLRHPDMQQFLYQQLPDLDHTELDVYMIEHLQNQITQSSPGIEPKHGMLLEVSNRIHELIKTHLSGKTSLSQWAQRFSDLLSEIYASHQLKPHHPEDAILIEPLTHIARVLREWFTVSSAVDQLAEKLDLQQAAELLRGEIANTPLPSPGAESVVEILGWLELHLDDAPHLYVLNFNEGFVPGDVKIDPFLPDSICEKLGLTCDKSRLARDRYMLEAIMHSRKHLRLIAGKMNLRNEPMLPSRLMLQCSDVLLAQTVIDYFQSPPRFDAPLLPSKNQSDFLLHRPIPPEQPINQLPVTAFKDYIQCPYRFYLKHIRKLRTHEEYVPELSTMAIGNLAHHIFETFGKSDWIDCTDDKALEQYFSELLDQFCDQHYGKNPLPAVVIQREQLRLRLCVFAQKQARMRSEGWKIITPQIESKHTVELMVNDEPFTLVGRIDRMDRHEKTGQLRIMDYKTSESSIDPDSKHRRKESDQSMAWVDLQLPLYRVLAASEIYDDKVQLGYCQLGKDLKKIGFDHADWSLDELDDALLIAKQIIRDVRNGIFWPPHDPPAYEDGLGGICQDAYPYRRLDVLTASSAGGEA